jgi:uncharacterized lipoprotein YddW (UPF0748 family)
MHLKYTYGVFFVLCCLITGCSTTRSLYENSSGETKRAFRGAWIQTVFQEEYKTMTPEQLKKAFIRKLDDLQACGINAIIFQVRPEADAFYQSGIEPWSRFYTGKQGLAPEDDFDLMKFLISACHRRNMEFHAWLNPFRAATSVNMEFAGSHIYHTYPERFVTYNNQILFDPGLPENRQHICRVVRDIVGRYDVDAIHMDDYFYPYPVAGLPFPDDTSFRKYGLPKGYTEERRGDWRRENVNTLVRDLKHAILLEKPWVRFGISPFGIYRNRKSTPDGSGSETNGLQNYDDLYADILYWIEQGWIDYTIPQIYWEIGHQAADYATLTAWWSRHTKGGHLYIGQDVARTMKAGQLTQKMACARRFSRIDGHCFWPANELLWNNQGIADSLKRHYHRYPALIPAYTGMHHDRPDEVKGLRVERVPEGRRLSWNAEQNPEDPELPRYFVVYRFGKKERLDLDNPARIMAITQGKSYMLPENGHKETFRYVVTAVDRFHNESKKGRRIKVKP